MSNPSSDGKILRAMWWMALGAWVEFEIVLALMAKQESGGPMPLAGAFLVIGLAGGIGLFVLTNFLLRFGGARGVSLDRSRVPVDKQIVWLLQCIKRDCESGDAPLNDTWWLTGSWNGDAVHVSIYEETLDILEKIEGDKK